MPLFGSITGPRTDDIKITFENILAMLSESKYSNGIDKSSTMDMIADVYMYLAGDRNMRIRCPAPADDPEDRYRIMWPEGAKVQSRASSRASSLRSDIPKLSNKYDSKRIRDRASSVTSSSKYTRTYVGIINEDVAEEPKPKAHRSRRKDTDSNNTLRVNGAVVKPSKSLERIFSGDFDDQAVEEEAPRPAAGAQQQLRKRVSRVGFADDE